MWTRIFVNFFVRRSLLFQIIIIAIVAFFIGVWWSGTRDVTHRIPSENEQEKQWRAQGLLFDDGIYFVGTEINPGIYRTTGFDASLYGCRWQRLSGFGAENDNIVVNYVEDRGMPTIVEISQYDKGFKTQGCGKWYAESIPVITSKTSFSDGAYLVNHDIEPGTYKSNAQQGCYWERLNGVTREYYSARLFGNDSELLASSSNTIATIDATDKAFISFGCHQWIQYKG